MGWNLEPGSLRVSTDQDHWKQQWENLQIIN